MQLIHTSNMEFAAKAYLDGYMRAQSDNGRVCIARIKRVGNGWGIYVPFPITDLSASVRLHADHAYVETMGV